MIRVAVCAPSAPIEHETANKVWALAARDFPDISLHFHPQCFEVDHHFAGSDKVRREAYVECANDPSMDVVWHARGGYGSNRIAAETIAQLGPAARNKQYLGYSDAGYMLGALYRAKTGRPVHAPMPVDIGRTGGEETVSRVLRYLQGDRTGLDSTLDARPAAAFNLITLAMMTGTPIMPDLSGHVVMLEEVSEHLYSIDRLFFHLTAHLRGVAGIRMGRASDIPENDRPFGKSALEIAEEWCAKSGIPFLGLADIGHDADNRIVPFGTR